MTRICYLMLIAFTIVVGCQPKAKDPTGKVASVSTDAESAQSPSVQLAVTKFLKAVVAQNVPHELLTIEYKKELAPPVFDGDKQLGYSAEKLTPRLQSFQGITFPEEKPSSIVSGDRAGFAIVPGKHGNMYIRLTRPQEAWLVDWIVFSSEKQPVKGPMPEKIIDASGWFAGFALLDLAQKNSFAHAALFLSKSGKSFLAPPIFDSEKPAGFSEEYLLRTALPRLFPTGSTCENLTISQGTITGDAVIGGQKKKLTMTVSPGSRPGEMLVDRVEFR